MTTRPGAAEGRKRPMIVVKCVQCGARREIAPGEVAANDFPMCEKDFMPMMPEKAHG